MKRFVAHSANSRNAVVISPSGIRYTMFGRTQMETPGQQTRGEIYAETSEELETLSKLEKFIAIANRLAFSPSDLNEVVSSGAEYVLDKKYIPTATRDISATIRNASLFKTLNELETYSPDTIAFVVKHLLDYEPSKGFSIRSEVDADNWLKLCMCG